MNAKANPSPPQKQQAQASAVRIPDNWDRTFEMVPDLVLLLDKQYQVVRANQAAAKQFGCAPEDLVGRKCYQLVHGIETPPDCCPYKLVLADGREHCAEIYGEQLGIHLSVSATPIRGEAGETVGAVYLARDISKLKRVEADLLEARENLEQRYALTVAASLDGLWEWQIAADTVVYSKRFKELLGYSHDEVPHTLEFFRSILHPDDADATWAAVDRHWENRTPFDLEYRLRTKTGEYRWFRVRGRTQRDEEGSPKLMAGSLQDITDRRNAQEVRNFTVELLSRVSEACSLEELLDGATVLLQRWSRCEAVGIRLIDAEDFPYFETEGFSDEFVHSENSLCSADSQQCPLRDSEGVPILECMCGHVIGGQFDAGLPYFTEAGSYWTNSTSELPEIASPRKTRLRKHCAAEGYESVALIPLRASGETLGLLQFNDHQKGRFTEERIALYEQFALSIATAVAQQKALSALRTSEKNLLYQQRSLSEAQRIAHLGNWDWNMVTDELIWSDETYRIFGFEPQAFDATAEAFYGAVHPEDRDRLKEAADRALADPATPYCIEHRVVRPDGSQRFVAERGNIVRDEAGNAEQMMGTVQDITELKQTELKLRDALKRVENLKDRLSAENVYLQEELQGLQEFDEIIGDSGPLRMALHNVDQVAITDANVLLLGETGTGKELFARAIHERSTRRDGPLVKVNCAALPSNLIESELFGHIMGAFTGALSDRVGRFELADGGTLFLDEVGELDLNLQTKLLRVLQEGEFERIGSANTSRVDVRVIAATNRDLEQAMADGLYRQDLYYRLAVFPIHVPTLRERRTDIPILAWHFIAKKRASVKKNIETVPEEFMQALIRYDWPGNVRELENVIERAMILSSGSVLAADDSFLTPISATSSESDSDSLEDVERLHIQRILAQCNWQIKGDSGAAHQLGMQPSTLRYRMKKLGIVRP